MHPTRAPLIAGNWKMFHGGATGVALAHGVAQGARGLRGVEIVVAPPFTALAAVAHEVQGSPVEVAAQNMAARAEGAFTGEVSAPMLLESGCRWVILGHSERRQLYGETDEAVREKTRAALAAGLRPIVCIGETLAEREAGTTLAVLARQVDAFAGELVATAGTAVVAYEPVWAIGTGKVAGPDQAQEAHAAVRARLAAAAPDLAARTRILYGGSVKADNAGALLACPDVDGALVGGASLDPASFLAIARAALGS
ncbi:MAG: triose-phosphate isomerase [Deltaproteobacteria bacterium]|nr:triose-phosphate isomerase [Deltaproteobacteria bacterium]